MNEPRLIRKREDAEVRDTDMCLRCSQGYCVIDMGDGLEIPCANLVGNEPSEEA